MRENMQVPRPADFNENGAVHLHSYFPTIQGEGPFCGERALFFRLNGCNLRCPGCDTEYTNTDMFVNPAFFVNTAKELGWAEGALVVITGGEPFRQNIAPMCRALVMAGYRVQVETNGVLFNDGLPFDPVDEPIFEKKMSIVCSPKTSRIDERLFEYADAFKYVLRLGDISEDDGLPLRALGHKATPHVARPRPGALVYVQPMDEGNAEANYLNLQAAIQSCMKFGYRLQIQVHKIINME